MFGKKTGICVVVFGVVLIILGSVLSYAINNKINSSIDDIWVYKYDKKFDDPAYQDCSNETRSFYLYNITNVENVLFDGEKPLLELKGPYNFTQKTCKYDVSLQGNIEFSREWVTIPELQETETIHADDRIFTFNLGYNGLMRALREAVPGAQPEFVLGAQLAGPVLGHVIESLQAPSTIFKIKSGSAPVILSTMGGQFRAAVEPYAINIVDAQYFGYSLQLVSADQLFNNVSQTGGVSAYLGISLELTSSSINLILNGNSSRGQPGILSDLQHGVGVGFIRSLEEPSLIGVTSVQLTNLQYFLNNLALVAYSSQVEYTQTQIFYTQWVSSGVAPPTDINGDGIPDLELSTTDTGISLEIADLLWDPESDISINSASGIATWYIANSNDTILATLRDVYSLTDEQAMIVSNWTVNLLDNVVPLLLEQQFEVTSMSDLAYAQWGLGTVFGGSSVYDLNPGQLPGVPEFSIWVMQSFGLPVTFSAAQSKSLLTDPVTGLHNGNNILTLLSAHNVPSVVNSTWGITTAQAGLLAAYFNYFIDTFSDAYITSFFENYESGPIVAVTPMEYIWSKQEPLLKLLGQNPNIGFVAADEFPFNTKEVADASPPLNETVFLGGSSEELAAWLHQVRHKDTGNTTLNIWRRPYKVGGWTGAAFPRGFDEDSIDVWFNLFLRIIPFQRNGTLEFKGLTLNKYDVDPSTFMSVEKHPYNDLFYQNIDGMVNLTSYYHPEMYGSYPNFIGVDENYTNTVDIISEDPSWYGISLDVEPETSVTLKYYAGLCAYVMIHPTDRYFPGLNVTGLAPVIAQYEHKEATDDDVDKVKTVLKLRKAAYALLIVGPLVGGILVVAGVLMLIRWYTTNKRTFVKQIDQGN